MTDLCPTCGQAWPDRLPGKLTERELDLLSAWRHTQSVKLAAAQIGVGEQRAKNMLSAARNRSGAQSNAELLHLHLADLLSRADVVVSQTTTRSAA